MATLDAIVVGGGQAGLAAGYELQRRGLEFEILDALPAAGESWRRRWDSLRLFTPARYSELAGMDFERPRGADRFWCPGKDEMAGYLAAYADRFSLPVRSDCRVESLRRDGDDYKLRAGGRERRARAVIAATGAHQRPFVPDLAARLDPAITQLHAAEYRRPDEIAEGPVLVVGAGASGAEIALDLARSGHEPVTLAGPSVGTLPGTIAGIDLYWWLYASGVVRARCHRPPGSWICRYSGAGGDELVGIGRRDFARAGIRRAGRISAVADGLPRSEDGEPIEAGTVIWCTGYRPGFGEWIESPALTAGGELRQMRGVVAGEPALFTVGRPFQARPDSGLVGGVKSDAAFVADRLVEALR